MAFLYMREDESIRGAVVTGDKDADFEFAWLTNGNPNQPLKYTGNPTWTITPAAAVYVNGIVIGHHNIDAGRSVVVAGDVSAVLVPGALPPDEFPLNLFKLLPAGVNVSSFSVAVTSNSIAPFIGEVFAGRVRALERQLNTEPEFEEADPFEWESDLPPYDTGDAEPRRLAGTAILSGVGVAAVKAWYQSTKRGTRPTVIIPIDTEPDPWFVAFRYFARPVRLHPDDPAQSVYIVDFEFREVTGRTRG